MVTTITVIVCVVIVIGAFFLCWWMETPANNEKSKNDKNGNER